MKQSVKLNIILCMLTVLTVTTSTIAQDIEAFGRACLPILVPNELETQFSNDSEAAFRDAVCGDFFNAHREQVEGQGEINVLEIFSVGAGGSSDRRTVTRIQYCQDRNLTATTRTRMSFWSRIVPNDAREQFNSCMDLFRAELESRTPNPVKVSASQAGDAGVTITVRWDRNVQPSPQPVFERFDNGNIDCPRNAIPLGTRIPVEGRTARCTWGRNFPTQGIVVAQIRGGGSAVASIRRVTPRLGTAELRVTRLPERVVAQDMVCGDTVRTSELHEVECEEGCACPGDGKWCYHNRTFQVRARSSERRRIHSPRLICQDDNQGSCAWNGVGDTGRLSIIRNDGLVIEAQRVFGSRSIGVRLCATEDTLDNVPETSTDRTYELFEGNVFVAEVPNGATGVLMLHLGGSQEQAIQVGTSVGRLRLLNPPVNTPTSTLFTYQVVPLTR
jgi:hypothetical protein